MSIRPQGTAIWRVLLGAVLASASAASAAGAAGAADRMNVLFISVDDLRPEIGAYGAPAVTPHIDRLAAEGMRFDRAYTAVAACAASRASMLTGAYPHTTRVFYMGPRLADANPELVTMPEVFREAGYEAVEIGKFLHKPGDAPGAFSRERFMPPWNPPEYLAPGNEAFAGRTERPRGPLGEAADVADDAYLDGKLAVRAVEELARLRDRPFFLAVGFVRPHLPFNCPARYWDLYDRAGIALPDNRGVHVPRLEWHKNYEVAAYSGGESVDRETGRFLVHGYRACVSYIDAQVGRLLDALDRLNLSDRTVVVLWGDHGWHLGEHGMWGKNTALEPSLRVPLILRVPGQSAPHETRALVESVDLLPTLCELAGIDVPAQVAGASFLPLLADPGRPWKRAVFGWRQRNTRTGQTVRTDRYRLVRWTLPGEGPTAHPAFELYDHASDPREYRNRAGDPVYADTVRALNRLIDRWLAGENVAFSQSRIPDPIGTDVPAAPAPGNGAPRNRWILMVGAAGFAVAVLAAVWRNR